MIVVLLILHGLLAVALLGAITHQAFGALPRAAAQGERTFISRFRSVNAPAYASPVVVLFVWPGAQPPTVSDILHESDRRP